MKMKQNEVVLWALTAAYVVLIAVCYGFVGAEEFRYVVDGMTIGLSIGAVVLAVLHVRWRGLRYPDWLTTFAAVALALSCIFPRFLLDPHVLRVMNCVYDYAAMWMAVWYLVAVAVLKKRRGFWRLATAVLYFIIGLLLLSFDWGFAFS